MKKTKKFKILGILNTGDNFEDHDHEQVFSFMMEGKTAQEVKEEIIERLCLEIQIADEKEEIIPIFNLPEKKWEESFDAVALNDLSLAVGGVAKESEMRPDGVRVVKDFELREISIAEKK